MKTYFATAGSLLLLSILFVIVLPYLFSANDDLDVGLAITIIILMPPTFFVLVRNIWKNPEIQAFVKGLMK